MDGGVDLESCQSQQQAAIKPLRKRQQKSDQRFSLQSDFERSNGSDSDRLDSKSSTLNNQLPTTLPQFTKAPANSLPQSVAKYSDNLSAYMDKILQKTKRDENVSVFSKEISVPEKFRISVEKLSKKKTSNPVEETNQQHIYEFIEVPKPKVELPTRPPRGFCKITEIEIKAKSQKPPTGKSKPKPKTISYQHQQQPQHRTAADIWSWPSNQSASLPPLTEEAVEQFFEQERRKEKSSTVGAYFRRMVSSSSSTAKPSQTTFFQQLGKRMKESLGSFGRSSEVLLDEPQDQNRPADPDWVFFRGFGGKSPSDIVEPYAIYDIPRPTAPPRRKKGSPKRKPRSASMSDIRSEIVLSSGVELKMEPVYDVPRSTPIYAVVNRAAKIKNRPNADANLDQTQDVNFECLPGPCNPQQAVTMPLHGSGSGQSASPVPCSQDVGAAGSETCRSPQVAPKRLEDEDEIDSRCQRVNKIENDENCEILVSTVNQEIPVPDEDPKMYNAKSDIDPKRESCPEPISGGNTDTESPLLKNPAWPNIDQPIFISPWNNNTTQQRNLESFNKDTNQNFDTVSQPEQSSIHPYTRRTRSRYIVEQKQLFHSSESDEKQQQEEIVSYDDSFDEIIRTANKSIETAESILSTLRREDIIVVAPTGIPDAQTSPVSDIETNIRRLEKAQDEINAALATFRTVQALNGGIDKKGPPPTPPRPSLQVMSTVAKRVAQFDSQKKRVITISHSQTIPDGMDSTKRTPGSGSDRPLRPVRRHSFNSSKTTALAESGDSHYEADVDTSSITESSQTNRDPSSNQDNGSSLSDSEAGVLPFRGRLKGLWGSFRKKRMEAIQANPAQRNNGSLYNCFGDYVTGVSLPNGEGGGDTVDMGIEATESSANSSASYHTPGSPAKQQSESSSSLSSESYNPLNRNSGSSDESSERGHQIQETASSTKEGAPPNLTSPHQVKAFYIARELMTSERVFVDVLKLLNVEFREYIQKARRDSKAPVISDNDYRRLFSNLPELQALNEDLLQDFESRVEHWGECQKISDVIAKKGPFLKLYNNYIREFSSLTDHFEECCRNYPKFKKLVQDFEAQDRCKNLRLLHYMLKPVQRLPQYRLLLEDYLKHLDQNCDDFDDTTLALRIVSEVAEQADNTIKQGENFRRMWKLKNRLGDSIDLIRPGRHLIKEGELMKISRKGTNPRYFILLSDVLLYTAYSGTGDVPSLKLSYIIPLTSLRVKALSSKAEDFQNEFSITSTVRSCTLRASSLRERNEWLDALHTAIEDHQIRKSSFMERGKLPNELDKGKPGEVAPVWVPDRRVTMCQKCAVEFTVLVRRHHCRACGQVVCSTCSANKAPLKYRNYAPARVCDSCYDIIEEDLSKVSMLSSKFHKRDPSIMRQERHVPDRLKLGARGEGAQMCGYLKRRSKTNRTWKKMWYVLKDRVLYVYKAPEDNVAVESIPVIGYTLELPSENASEIYEGESANLVFKLSHQHETFAFFAENQIDEWVPAIKSALSLESGQT